MPKRVPRNVEEVHALRDYEVEVSEDDSPYTSRRGSMPSRRKIAPAGLRQTLAPQKRSALCTAVRGCLILILVAINVFVLLLVLDEYYRIEVCHAVSPNGGSRVCHLLGLKNLTLEAAEMGMEEYEKIKPYVLNYTAEAQSFIQEKIKHGSESGASQ